MVQKNNQTTKSKSNKRLDSRNITVFIDINGGEVETEVIKE
jgi:hypothetical protein